MPETIAVVEDDRDLCTLLEYNLVKNGYRVMTFHRLGGAARAIREQRADLVLLDVMLPDGDGFDFCRRLREDSKTAGIPVLFLTARSQEIDKILGLEIGGDDYITKPFSPRELLARIRAHLRRARAAGAGRTLSAGGLEIDFQARQASRDGNPLPLTATEFAVLGFLAENPGKAFTRQQLIGKIWNGRSHVSLRNIDVHIRRLREQIEEDPKRPQWLHTVRGFGYRFDIPA